MLLVIPSALAQKGEVRAKYALATAGDWGDHGEERGKKEAESESGSSESESMEIDGRESDAGGKEGGPPLPYELREAHVRQKTESERLRTKRTARIAKPPNPNKCDTRKRAAQFPREDKWRSEEFGA